MSIAVAPKATAEPLASIGPPNVVILMSDDQRWDKVTQRYTPNIWNQLVLEDSAAHPALRSVAFKNGFASNPTCCPSRTTVLTGNYSHTTGVWDNVAPFGGFASFDDEHTLAVDFQQAGYRTGLVGKYLNGYMAGRGLVHPARLGPLVRGPHRIVLRVRHHQQRRVHALRIGK